MRQWLLTFPNFWTMLAGRDPAEDSWTGSGNCVSNKRERATPCSAEARENAAHTSGQRIVRYLGQDWRMAMTTEACNNLCPNPSQAHEPLTRDGAPVRGPERPARRTRTGCGSIPGMLSTRPARYKHPARPDMPPCWRRSAPVRRPLLAGEHRATGVSAGCRLLQWM